MDIEGRKSMNNHPKARSALYSSLIVLCSLLFSAQVAAQDLSAVEQAKIRQAIQGSLTSKSSYNGVAGIPRHELYMMLFAEILVAPESAPGFTSEDWEIITSLPSHSDRRFRAMTDREMETFCRFVETEKRTSVEAAVEVATYYNKAKTATDELLGRHYDTVVEALSEQGQAALQQRIRNMNDRMELVHTDIDINILAQSVPAYTIRMFKSGCVRTKAARDANPAQSLSLSEELIRNAEIVSPPTPKNPEALVSQ